MFIEAIEKLKETKDRLTTEFVENRIEYKAEIKKINTAIRKFQQGYEVLGNTPLETSRKRGIADEIEKILVSGPKHINEILEELTNRGFSPKYQSVSAILQVHAKAKRKFVKILPATYALIPLNIEITKVSIEQNGDDRILLDEILTNDEFDF